MDEDPFSNTLTMVNIEGFFSAGTQGNAVPAPPALNVCNGVRRWVGGGTKERCSEVGGVWNHGMMLGGG